jgi:hypothetical protein
MVGVDSLYPSCYNSFEYTCQSAPVHELIPMGPFTIEIELPESVNGNTKQCLVSGAAPQVELKEGSVRSKLPSVTDHEVVVIE